MGPGVPLSRERRKRPFRAPAPPERAAAVLLRLGHPRLPVLRRFFAAGAGGRHIVGLCRTVDPRIRLVARPPFGGGGVWRGICGADPPPDPAPCRPSPRPPGGLFLGAPAFH